MTALTSGWDGVADAAITPDGTTIQMRFSDGVMAIIATGELYQASVGSQSVAGLGDRLAPVIRENGPGEQNGSGTGHGPVRECRMQ